MAKLPKKYKFVLRTLNLPIESGGKRLTTHEREVHCDDGFSLCCAAIDFASNFGSDHNEGKKLIAELKKRVQSEAMHVSETSLRRTGQLHLEDSLYIFDITPIEESSCL